jgi:hypothetical protein
VTVRLSSSSLEPTQFIAATIAFQYINHLHSAVPTGCADLMSYEFLVAIVAANAVVTFGLVLWLRQIEITKANRPVRLDKKAAKLVWQSDPIVPRHDPPKGPSHYARKGQLKFFADFKEFADIVNSALADSYGNTRLPSRFRLQDLPDDEVHIVRTESPTPGRCFKLYFNQYPIGRLDI